MEWKGFMILLRSFSTFFFCELRRGLAFKNRLELKEDVGSFY